MSSVEETSEHDIGSVTRSVVAARPIVTGHVSG
jgi:hypothetical protein